MAHIGRPEKTSKGIAHPVRWRDHDKRVRERWVYGGVRQARAVKSEIEAELQKGGDPYSQQAKLPLAQVADEWITSLTDVKPRTVAEYRRLLDTRVLPNLGSKRAIGSIRRADVDKYINALKADGIRAETISRAFHPLRATLAYAVDVGYIPKSPYVARMSKLPKGQGMGQLAYTPRFLSGPEVRRACRRMR